METIKHSNEMRVSLHDAYGSCPPVVTVQHEQTGVYVTLGRSAVDGKLALHIDGRMGDDGLARVHLNSGLMVEQGAVR